MADILDLIPLDMHDYQNSEVGEWPRTFLENFIQLIAIIVSFIIFVLIIGPLFFALLITWLVDAGVNLRKRIEADLLC